jgi:regulator of protease activity HflC (stomatin/prohibitin superfamily)
MRFLGTLIVLAFLGGITYLTFLDKVPAGHVGVKVHLLGTEKGVGSEELGPGRYLIGFNEQLFLFPTFTQNYVWTATNDDGSPNDEGMTFQSGQGLDIGADVGITYSVDATKVSTLFERYRKGLPEITDGQLRNMVRDALVGEASKMTVEAIYGAGKTEMMQRVEEKVRTQVAPFGIKVERVYWIGKLRLPEQVIAAINSEISANSQARQRENEVAASKAEADKARAVAAGEADAITALAEAQAEANTKLARSITPELVEYLQAQKWDGALPQVTGGATPLISLK